MTIKKREMFGINERITFDTDFSASVYTSKLVEQQKNGEIKDFAKNGNVIFVIHYKKKSC